MAFSPCETSLRKKQAETLWLHLSPCSQTAARVSLCPPAFGSGFNSFSSCNRFPAAKPGKTNTAQGRNRKARILLPNHRNRHLSGMESWEKRTLKGTQLPAETLEESQLLVLPGTGTMPAALAFTTCKETMVLLGATTEPTPGAPLHPRTRQHPPPAITQPAAPPSAQPTRLPRNPPIPHLPNSPLHLPNRAASLLVGAEPSPDGSPTYTSAVKRANAKLNLEKGNHK